MSPWLAGERPGWDLVPNTCTLFVLFPAGVPAGALSSRDVPDYDYDEDEDGEGGIFDIKKLQANLSENINKGCVAAMGQLLMEGDAHMAVGSEAQCGPSCTQTFVYMHNHSCTSCIGCQPVLAAAGSSAAQIGLAVRLGVGAQRSSHAGWQPVGCCSCCCSSSSSDWAAQAVSLVAFLMIAGIMPWQG
jgi:hypothetical protein